MAVAASATVSDAADAPRETDGAAPERPAGIDHAAS